MCLELLYWSSGGLVLRDLHDAYDPPAVSAEHLVASNKLHEHICLSTMVGIGQFMLVWGLFMAAGRRWAGLTFGKYAWAVCGPLWRYEGVFLAYQILLGYWACLVRPGVGEMAWEITQNFKSGPQNFLGTPNPTPTHPKTQRRSAGAHCIIFNSMIRLFSSCVVPP